MSLNSSLIRLCFALVLLSFVTSTPALAAVKSYYVDCNGNDANAGTAVATAWKSLTKANSAPLQPGDSIFFKRGCTWNGRFKASWTGTQASPVTISAYGTGNLPIIQSDSSLSSSRVEVSGSYQVLENLEVRTINPKTDPNCKNQTIGYFVGFNFIGSSARNTVRNSKISGHTIGVHITDNSHHNKILNNEIFMNSVMNQLTPDSSPDLGAWGIDLRGDDNEIAFNYLHDNNGWCAYDFSIKPGNAIEIYNGDRNNIHHNKVVNDRVFSEVGHDGSHTSDDNQWLYNSYVSSTGTSRFLVLHGTSNPFGPVLRSRVFNNSVYLTGSSSTGIGGGEKGTVVINNIIYAPSNIINTSGMIQYSNIFWSPDGSPQVSFMGNNDKKVNPQFNNPAGGDLSLKSSSPAINTGVNPELGFTIDAAGNSVPVGQYDIGAYEYGGSPVGPTSPVVSPTRPMSPTVTASPTRTPSPSGTGCSQKSKGDANCDNQINLTDFEIWRKEFTDSLTTLQADFNGDHVVLLQDFEIWRTSMFQ